MLFKPYSMRLLFCFFMLVPSPASAQPDVVHHVPFAAGGNTLALTVVNTAEEHATAATVTLADAPAWLAVTPDEVKFDSLAAGEEALASFSFDVAPEAPVGEAAAVRFTITTADGQAVEKSVWLEVSAPAVFRVDGAYPNPARAQTTFAYELPRAAEVRLAVYDVLGRRVAEVVREEQGAGRHEVPWSADGLASGLYVWRLAVEDAAGRQVAQHKLTLVR